MSAARDKFKCYALDLSLLAVSNRYRIRLVSKKRPLQIAKV